MPKIAIVLADYRAKMAEKMLSYAKKKAKECSLEIATIVRVPGAFEIPLAVKRLLEKKEIKAVVCLAVVLRGGTDHDKIVAGNAVRKIADLSIEFNKPVLSGIIGPRVSKKQALKRLQSYSEHAIEATARMLSLKL